MLVGLVYVIFYWKAGKGDDDIMIDKDEKKNLLIYAHYYIPDSASTGQIIQELAEGMLSYFNITVICVVPSYEGAVAEEYKIQKFYEEEINGIKVIRLRVPEFNKTNKWSRVKNIFAYFFGAISVTKRVGKKEYIFSISQPPIIGGLLGVYGKWKKHASFIYNIQDFNPEQIMAVHYIRNKFITGLMMVVDKFTCRSSDLIITVGSDLVETLRRRFHNRNVPKHAMINNWIDEKKVYPLPISNEKILDFKKEYGIEGKFVIMYSGNIGLYYDLENLLKVFKQFRKGYTFNGQYEEGPKTTDGREVVFVFIGAGSVLDKLVLYKKKHHFENVVFIPYQEKENIIYSLNAGDVHCCVNAKGIKGVSCPSKVYGIMAVGKPILGILEKGTEARGLIEQSGCGKCCEPGNYDDITKTIQWYIENAGSDEEKAMGINGRRYLEKYLAKDISVNRYATEIMSL